MSTSFLFLIGGVIALSAALTKLLMSARTKGIDVPKAHSIHAVPTPRLGGIAVLLSMFAGVIASGWLIRGEIDELVAIALACAAILFSCFVVEDVVGVSWKKRLLAQIAAACAFLGVSEIWLSIGGSIPLVLLPPLLILLAVGMVWSMNLYNFMDGIDGLAAGMTISGFAMMGVLAFQTGNEWVGVTAFAVVGGAAGFLAFNFPPARIFLGDAGSVPLGFLGCALGLILITRRAISPIVPLVLFAPFVIDATMTLLGRAFRGLAFWEPHRQHWYQRGILAGWSHRHALAVYYPLMLLSAAAAFAMQYAGVVLQLAIASVVLAAHAVVPALVNRLEGKAASARSANRTTLSEQGRRDRSDDDGYSRPHRNEPLSGPIASKNVT